MNGKIIMIALCGLTLSATACKSAKEMGEDAAKNKLDFAQGAADVLQKQGGTLGETVGKGATDLVKGIGTGVKDSAHPPIEIKNTGPLKAAGLTIHSAVQEGDGLEDRTVNAYIGFSRPFTGRLKMRLLDEKGVEIGNAVAPFTDQPGTKADNIRFSFDSSVRLSKVSYGEISIIPPTPFKLSLDLEPMGLQTGRILEKDGMPFTVIPYLIFNKSWKGTLQLRAYDGAGLELERSAIDVNKDADSSESVSFTFSNIKPLQVSKYELFGLPAKKGR